jgi:hypothetical protein
MLTLFLFLAHPQFQLISKSYLQEVEWCHQGYIPSFNDHVNVSTISAGIQLLCVGLLVGMGDVATKEVFEWVIGSNNDVIRACAEVTRFMDDMADFKVFIYIYTKSYSYLKAERRPNLIYRIL